MICVMFNYNGKGLSKLTQADGYRIFGDDQDEDVANFIQKKALSGAICHKFKSMGAFKAETQVVQF